MEICLPKTPLEWVNYAFHGVGLCVIAIVGIRIWRRGAASRVLTLRPPPDNDLQPAHLLLGFAAVSLYLPLLLSIIHMVTGDPAATQAVEEGRLTPQATLAQTISQTLTVLTLCWIGISAFRGNRVHWGLDWRRWPRWLWRSVIVDFAAWPVCSGVLLVTALVIQTVLPEYRLPEHQTITTLLREHPWSWQWVLSILGAVVLAPLVEELFFRGLLQPAIAGWTRSAWAGVLLSGGAFGLLHMTQPQVVPALAIFGMGLGYAYARTRSLTFVIFIHAVFNLRTIVWIVLGADVTTG